MYDLLDKLKQIEKEHADFFEGTGKSITDYITEGIMGHGVFINTQLPLPVIAKIRIVFDQAELPKDAGQDKL